MDCKDCVHFSYCAEKGEYLHYKNSVCMKFTDKNRYVDVVRCKDCIHAKTLVDSNDNFVLHCSNSDRFPIVDGNYFCGNGEKKIRLRAADVIHSEEMKPMRKQLMKLFDEWRLFTFIPYETERMMLADFLIANGAFVPPCKIGDIVYDISDGTAYPTRVLNFVFYGDRWACRTVSSFPNVEEFGTRIFLNQEEAEKAIAERKDQ